MDHFAVGRSLARLSAMLCVSAGACLLLTGCHIDTHKNANGNDDVSISTPLGGMNVKTNAASTAATIGLPGYPGATVVNDNKDKGSADVDMNFGKFHLRVRAVTYRSSDSPEKVLAFYRKALTQYGDIVECHDNQPVGTPTRTGQGLDCSDKDDNKNKWHGHGIDDKESTELKTGSRQHQRIVSTKTDGDGTKFSLLLLDLPHDDD